MNLAGLETNYQEILFSDNPGQNCRDNSCFSPSLHYNVDFSRSPKSRSVHRSLACFNIVWGEGGRKKGSERRTNVAHITVETCTVNSLLFAQNLTSVPKCFDPDCLRLSSIEYNWKPYHICPQNSKQFVTLR